MLKELKEILIELAKVKREIRIDNLREEIDSTEMLWRKIKENLIDNSKELILSLKKLRR